MRQIEKRLTGTVKWFNPLKGFGFIQPDGQDIDVFVHVSSVQKSGLRTLWQNQRITFELITDRFGKVSAGKIQTISDLPDEFHEEIADYLDNTNIYYIYDIEVSYKFIDHGHEIERHGQTKLISILERFKPSIIMGNFDFLERLNGERTEELCMEILDREGYSVQRKGRWNEADGGVDLIATLPLPNGINSVFAVQCKSSMNKITAVPIRALNGVLEAHRADAGIIMTTSILTEPADDELRALYYRIKMRDYNNLKQSLKRIFGK